MITSTLFVISDVMFDPKTAQESETYVIEEKDFHIVCGDCRKLVVKQFSL